jgi:hypothetical protein
MGAARIVSFDLNLVGEMPPGGDGKEPGAGGVKAAKSREEYLDRLLRIIPGEIIGGYTAARTYFLPATAPASPATAPAPPDTWAKWFAVDGNWLAWVLPIFFGVILFASRALSTLPDKTRASSPEWWREVQWVNVALSLGAFLVWTISLGDPNVLGLAVSPKIGGALVVMYAVLIWFFAQVANRA